jgi:hypothetical protein
LNPLASVVPAPLFPDVSSGWEEQVIEQLASELERWCGPLREASVPCRSCVVRGTPSEALERDGRPARRGPEGHPADDQDHDLGEFHAGCFRRSDPLRVGSTSWESASGHGPRADVHDEVEPFSHPPAASPTS